MSGYRRREDQGSYLSVTQQPSNTLYHSHEQYGFLQPPFQYNPHLLASYGQQPTFTSNTGTYPANPGSAAQLPTHQPLTHNGHPHSHQYASASRPAQLLEFRPAHETLSEGEIESQESCNEDTMMSEPIYPPVDGFPDVSEFDQLVKSYVDDLSVKKQDKALIHSRRARNIRTVLTNPKDTAIESAQFRFWVKKMFKLEPPGHGIPGPQKHICHEGKPVAIREKLFKILTKAHQQCQHGGRDKTSAQVRKTYSWVPKELISRFVKICPTCQVRRGRTHLTPPNSQVGTPRIGTASQSPMLLSSPESRCESMMCHSPARGLQIEGFPSGREQPGWMNSPPHVHSPLSVTSNSLDPLSNPQFPTGIRSRADGVPRSDYIHGYGAYHGFHGSHH